MRAHYDAGHSMRDCQAKFGFSGAAWSEAVRRGDIDPRPRAKAHDWLFVKGVKRNRYHLKRRLLADGPKEPVSEDCGIADWRGAPLSLELHHINGEPLDNRVQNLKLLCPNCDSQTDTWGGRAKLARAAWAGRTIPRRAGCPSFNSLRRGRCRLWRRLDDHDGRSG